MLIKSLAGKNRDADCAAVEVDGNRDDVRRSSSAAKHVFEKKRFFMCDL
jgi:hypothetical protein